MEKESDNMQLLAEQHRGEFDSRNGFDGFLFRRGQEFRQSGDGVVIGQGDGAESLFPGQTEDPRRRSDPSDAVLCVCKSMRSCIISALYFHRM